MNIVHLIFNIRPGGMEYFLIDLVEAQCQSDNVTVVVVNRDNDASMIENIKKYCRLVEIGRPQGSYNPYYVIKLNRVLKQLSPGVVNFHDRRLGAMILKRKEVRYIFTCHDMLQPLSFATRADKIIAVSEAVANWLKNKHNLESAVIQNGIAVDRIKQCSDRGLTSPIKLVSVARLDHTVKGQHILLKALSKLSDIDWTLDLIGEGASHHYLENLAKQLKIKYRVNFLSNVDRQDIYTRLSQYDIFILPSLNEAFSIALAEAMAASLPVIISNLEGPKSVAGTGEYATVFTPGNSDDLTLKIMEVIADYPKAYARAVSARKFIKESFDINETAKRYRRFYLGCLQKKMSRIG
ncbi:MAG: glycosyltransferase family 4 protein [Muribaculaceae bacterium]|nr:glycosyltransferase family 4 protein [Muribaculaceae bacterium]